MITAFHGTKLQWAIEISRNGFDPKKQPHWCGDLGNGVYGYIEARDQPSFSDPRKLAKQYGWLKARSQATIVKFSVDISQEGVDILDFTMNDVQLRYMCLLAKFESYYESDMSVFLKTPRKRKQLDGMILEWFIKHQFVRDVSVVVEDTHTDFYGVRSNFPNGREICVRKLDCIKNAEVIKYV